MVKIDEHTVGVTLALLCIIKYTPYGDRELTVVRPNDRIFRLIILLILCQPSSHNKTF